MILAPRHLPGFPQSQIKINIAWVAEVIPWTRFAWVRVAEALINLVNAASSKQLRRAIGRLIGTAMDSVGRSHIGLKVPVGCPAAIIERRNHRQPCVPAEYTGDLPAANDGVCGAAGTTRESATLPKKGNCQITSALMLCRTSKSELA